MTINIDIEKIVKKIEAEKMVIACARSRLEDIKDDLDTILESFKNGEASLYDAVTELRSAIDYISEVV